jgi:DNA-3-methyladenine glycosylase II
LKKSVPPFEHLKRDKKLAKIIDHVGEVKLKKRSDLYLHLLRAIVAQQLSTQAADTIWGRFIDLFEDQHPAPKPLLLMEPEKIRGAGLSYQKTGYLKNIAQFSMDKTLEYSKLKNKTDEELIEYLTEIKGVGRWTVEMILMFSLGRPDIMPVDDLGIQTAMKSLYRIDLEGKLLKEKMLKLSEKWRPHRTVACVYLWRWKDSQRKSEKNIEEGLVPKAKRRTISRYLSPCFEETDRL